MGEELFKTFNYFADKDAANGIHFLFAARKTEFEIAKNGLEPFDKKEVDHALNQMMRTLILIFDQNDAIFFLEKVLSIYPSKVSI